MSELMSKLDKYLNEDILVEGYASVHTNTEIESKLRQAGFDIPTYPRQGEVTLNGEKVGRMDNFNGLMISSKEALKVIKKALPKVGIWNPNNAK